MFVQIKNLLDRSINKHGLKRSVDALEIINVYKKVIKEQLNEEALLNLVPRYFKNNNLYINAANASWAQHFFLNQAPIIQKINAEIGQQKVKKFVIQITNKSLTTKKGGLN